MKAINFPARGQTSIFKGHQCRFDVNQPGTATLGGSLARLLHGYLAPSSHSLFSGRQGGY